MRAADIQSDITDILLTEEQIREKLQEIADQVAARLRRQGSRPRRRAQGRSHGDGRLLACAALPVPLEFMAVSSYGAGTKSSAGVRADPQGPRPRHQRPRRRDRRGHHRLGLTLSWLMENFASPGAVRWRCAHFSASRMRSGDVHVADVGFEIPNEFVVGYGLDYAEKYRNLRDVAVLAPTSTPDAESRHPAPPVSVGCAARLRCSASQHRASRLHRGVETAG